MRILKINFNFVISALILVFGLLVSYVLIAQALTEDDIVFPVSELGNCENEIECRTYCDKSENRDICLDFAERYNLISKEEIQRGRKFQSIGAGPGGCTDENACENYCEDISHIDECLSFAERHGFMSAEDLKEAKQVQMALVKGVKLPGGCTNKNECETYCEDPNHMEECIAFGEAAGFIPPDELKEAKKFLEAVKKGVKPPPCRGERECNAYCSEPGHFEECINFAEAAGFMSSEEIKIARKTGGVGPGGCRGRECEDFCEKEGNFQVCMDFAIEHGLMSPEEAEIARKTGGKGPGNCRGREECEVFCENPENQEVCFDFAKGHGLISEEELRNMEEGKMKMLEAFNNAPAPVKDCLNETIGAKRIAELQAGTALPSRELGDQIRTCFEEHFRQMGPQGENFPEGMPDGSPTGGFSDMPPEMMECLRSAIGADMFEKIKSGGAAPPSNFEDVINSCVGRVESEIQHQEFERMMPKEGMIPSAEEIEYMMRDGVPPNIPQELINQFGPEGFEGFKPSEGGALPNFPIPKEGEIRQAICPLMPTVSECPTGQKKIVVFDSPECGSYYGCAPEEGITPNQYDGYAPSMPENTEHIMEEQMQEIERQMIQEPMIQQEPILDEAEIQSSTPTLTEFTLGLLINLIRGAE